jgi:hypothetical protein
MRRFDTMQKELPTRRTPRRESVQRYRSNRSKAIAASSTSLLSTRSIKHNSISYLLFMKSAGISRGMLAVFASQRKIVSSAIAGNVPPEKEVPPVYTEVA